MLAEVKQRGKGVGGETQISVIRSDGEQFEVTQDQVTEYESTANDLGDLWKEAFKACFNLGLSQKQFHVAVDILARFLKTIRGPMVRSEVLRRAHPDISEEEIARLFRKSKPRSPLRSTRDRTRQLPSPELPEGSDES
jgi:hypothetical protein